MSRGYTRRALKLTPRKEDVRKGDQFKHRPVEILQIQVCFASVLRFIKSEESTQEVDGGYSGPATNLIRIVQFVCGDKLHGFLRTSKMRLPPSSRSTLLKTCTRSRLLSQVFRPPSYTPGSRSEGASRNSRPSAAWSDPSVPVCEIS